MNKQENKNYAETYCGVLGGMMPFLVMIGTIVFLAIIGLHGTQNYWIAGLLGVVAGFFFYKDKGRYQQAIINGVKSPTLASLIVILIFASIMAQVLKSSHLVEALLYVMSIAKIPAQIIPLLTFLIGTLMSTSSGSSAVVLYALTPVLFPVGVQLGCHPGLMLGAIVGGAIFGDNLAPISDTTITSALTQEADLNETVRSRIKYSMIAGVAAAVAFLVVGFMTTTPVEGSMLTADSTYASSLIFLLIPVSLLVMILKGVQFLVALLLNSLIGVALLVILGIVDFMSIFQTSGVIISGINGMLSAIMLITLIFMVLQLIQETGAMEVFQKFIVKHAKNDTTVEVLAGLFICGCVAMITSGLSSIAFAGPIVRDITKPFKLKGTRSANYLDGMCCALPYLLPYSMNALFVVSLAVGTGCVAEAYSPMDFIPFCFFNFTLMAVYWISILSGFGREHEKD